MNQEKQPEALRLAEELEQFRSFPALAAAAAAELRRLHTESEQHLQELRSYRITVENREARIAELEAAQALKAAPAKLEDIEQYRLQMAGISTAAFGYWKEGDDIHPDYDTLALRDVAKLYAKYDELYKAAHAAQAQRVPLSTTHEYEEHKKFPGACRHCGYAEHEELQHGITQEKQG